MCQLRFKSEVDTIPLEAENDSSVSYYVDGWAAAFDYLLLLEGRSSEFQTVEQFNRHVQEAVDILRKWIYAIANFVLDQETMTSIKKELSRMSLFEEPTSNIDFYSALDRAIQKIQNDIVQT